MIFGGPDENISNTLNYRFSKNMPLKATKTDTLSLNVKQLIITENEHQKCNTVAVQTLNPSHFT